MNDPSRVRLSAAQARQLSEQVLRNAGYDEREAWIIGDHVVEAALCGYEYSGLPKILNVLEKSKAMDPRQPMRAMHETPLSVMFDGGNNNGMLTLYWGVEAAIAKAQTSGIAIVAVTNSWTSGRGAYYVEKLARAGFIGVHTVSSARHVAPPGGMRAMLGTNPIAFGFPTEGDPLLIDLGTAAFMSTELSLYERLGRALPEGVAMDSAGQPTCDPHSARAGALLPFGGHKGFALGLAIQALGVLAGSGFNAAKDYGYLLLAIRPDVLLPLETFRQHLSEEIARIKATPRLPGVDDIRIPSERSFSERARHMREGIVIDRTVHDALMKLAGEPATTTLP
jgi:LDH2 family malate/lactate/ureidoglycolate dehydrogenase